MSSSQISTVLPFLFTAISKSHPNLPLFDVSAQNKHKKTLLTFYDNKSNGRKTSEWIMKLTPRLLNPTANNVPITTDESAKLRKKKRSFERQKKWVLGEERWILREEKSEFWEKNENFERRKGWILKKKRKSRGKFWGRKEGRRGKFWQKLTGLVSLQSGKENIFRSRNQWACTF